MEHENQPQQPQVVNEVVRNYLVISSSWARWLERAYERTERQPLIDNEGLSLLEGNDFA